MSIIYNTLASFGSSLINRCCPRRQARATSPQVIQQEDDVKISAAAISRLMGVAAAPKTTAGATVIKNTVLVLPLLTNLSEPLASSMIRPVVEFVISTKQVRILILSVIITYIAKTHFGDCLDQNYQTIATFIFFLIGLLLSCGIDNALIDKTPKILTKQLRNGTIESGLIQISQALKDYKTPSQILSLIPLSIVAYQKYFDPSKGLETSLPQTCLLTLALLMMNTTTIGKLTEDIAKGPIRAARGGLRIVACANKLTTSPLQALQSAINKEREETLARLPKEVRKAYLEALLSSSSYNSFHQETLQTIKTLQDDVNKINSKIEEETKKAPSDYKRLLDWGIRDDALRARQQEQIDRLTLDKQAVETKIQELIQQDSQKKQEALTANQALINLLASPTTAPEIRLIVEELWRTASLHHEFLASMKSIKDTVSKGENIVEKATTIAKVGGVFASLAVLTIGYLNPRIGIGIGTTLAGLVQKGMQVHQKVVSKQEEIKTIYAQKKMVVKNTFYEGGIKFSAKLITPPISKLLLNYAIAKFLEIIAVSYSPESAFIASQTANAIGWASFISLLLDLKGIYSEEYLSKSNQTPVSAAVHNIVDLLAATPKSPVDLLVGDHDKKRKSAHDALTKLEKVSTASFEFSTNKAETLLKAIIDLGSATNTLNKERSAQVEKLGGMVIENVINPIYLFQEARKPQSGVTYTDAIAATVAGGTNLAESRGHVSQWGAIGMLAATAVAQGPINRLERLLRSQPTTFPQAAGAASGYSDELDLKNPEKVTSIPEIGTATSDMSACIATAAAASDYTVLPTPSAVAAASDYVSSSDRASLEFLQPQRTSSEGLRRALMALWATSGSNDGVAVKKPEFVNQEASALKALS